MRTKTYLIISVGNVGCHDAAEENRRYGQHYYQYLGKSAHSRLLSHISSLLQCTFYSSEDPERLRNQLCSEIRCRT